MITNLQNLKPGTNFLVHEMPELSGVLVDINECSAKVGLGRRAVEVRIGDREFTAHKSRFEIWSPATMVEVISDDAQPATSPAAEPATCETCGAVTDRDHIGPICPACSVSDDEEIDDMATATKKRKSTPKKDAVRVRRTVKGTKAAEPAKLIAQPDEPIKKARKQKTDAETGKDFLDAATPAWMGPIETVEAKKDHPKPKANSGMSLLDAAAEVMSADKPMSCQAVIDAVLSRKLWSTTGKTPSQTLYSALIRDIDGKGNDSRFCRGDQKGEFKLAAK